MAGLHGLKILLLWAGLLGLARCATLPPSTSLASTSRNTSQAMGQNTPSVATNAPDLSTSTSQASITNQVQALPTSDSTNQALHSPTTHNPTSPASIPPFTTSVPGNQTSPCTYSVEPIEYGFQVNISSSIPGKYDVQFTDSSSKKTKNKTLLHELPVKTTVQNNSSKPVFSSTHPIKLFKPCTNYSVTMTGGIVTCNLTGEGTKQTKEMGISDKGHIMSNTTVKPGCLCYMSDWDLKDAITVNPECHTDSESLTPCIKLRAEHFCSTLNTSFSQACTDPFTKTTNLTWDLFEKSYIDIQIKDNNSLPLELVWGNMPKQCDGILNLTYFSCQSRSDKKDVNITDLQPFTDYDCNGRLKHNHTTIKNITFPVRVNCRLTMTIDRSDVLTFNNSIKLIWTSPPSNCRREDISFNYTCCCRESPKDACFPHTGSESDRQCKVSNLKPFTEYTCDIEAFHELMISSINKTTISNIKTEAGTPHMVTITTFSWQGNNAFKVKCEQNGDWNGPMQRYIAEFNGIETKKDTCEFEFKDLSYSTSYQLKVIAFNGKHRSEPTEKTINTSYNDRAVIGILSFFITLTSVALLFVLYKICILKRKKHYRPDDPGMKLIARSDEENLMNVEPIGAEVLLDAYKRKIADEGRLFLAEFQSIPRIFSSYTVKEAKRTSNQLKNRYVDILPYDYNRVQLTTGNGDTGSDYINASFIDGFKESNKYIAAQGPKDETVSDFWRMVWEQQSSIIVMVTRCEEGNRVKCTQYWPSPVREVEIFEEFVVKLNDEHHCPDYIIRRLSLTNKKDKNSDREVTHIQFTSWPDHGVPDESHLLLKLRRRVNAFKNLFSGPIVIHCSAGVGRTGSYISIDAMMEGLESEGRVDIYGYVVRLRRQRCLMVQVEAQYILIHQALIEYNQFGETEISLAELHARLGTLKQRDTDNEPTLLEAEFQRLPRYKSWRTFSVGITEENKKKNRNSSIVPYDYNRVLVKVEDEFSRDSDREEDEEDEEDESSDEEDEEATKYINASYIDGYWCPQSLMAAQGPLPTTTTDFWKMVHQKKVTTIVMLSECTESGQEFCSAYWGEETMTFGDVEVEVTGTETSGAYIVRSMQISHAKRKDKRQVKQYHFLKWADRELPEKPQDLTDMIKNIKQTCGYDNSMSGRSIPIVVHCQDGSSRTGVFCALWNILDSAETEKLFDVFQVTKALRKQRQNMIGSLEQYQFLYDALEGAFPVQNGEVKQATEVASVEIVNEKTGQAAEKQPGQAGGSTGSDQQEAAESDPLVADSENEAGDAETEGGAKEPASEKSPLEGTNNGPTVTV